MAERPERARLEVHRREPETQRALDAPRDAALVVEQRLEAWPAQTPHGELGLGHHRRGAGRVREERHLPEHLARAERRELLARAIAVRFRADGPYRRPALLDDVEAVRPVSLSNDDLTGLVVALLELAGQPGEVQAPEVREER
jgi:hypothetical protein